VVKGVERLVQGWYFQNVLSDYRLHHVDDTWHRIANALGNGMSIKGDKAMLLLSHRSMHDR
jgi:hypothetical protein